MGLLSALSNAVSGLNVNQQNLNVLSQNISNANTPNYSNEVVNQQAVYDNGSGVGVSIKDITRTVDNFLTAEVQGQTSVNSAASTLQSYYGQIENLLGQPGSTGTIDQGIDSFFTAMQDLANSPSVTTKTSAINAGVTMASEISGLATGLQSLRLQSDTDISNAIASINTDLQTLSTTNTALERASATQQPTAGLLDQRDAALADIAQYIDINPTYQEDGEVTVNTTNGLTLLTPTNSSVLSYTPASSTATFTNNDSLSPVQIQSLDSNGNPIGNPVTLVTGGTSTSVTTSLVSGKMTALLNMRDSVIPNIMRQLDQLSSTLTNSVNAVSNEGVSFPPPNSYTGSQLTTGGTNATQWSGNLQIALLDSNGNPGGSPYPDEPDGEIPLNLNLSTLVGSDGTAGSLTTGDIVNAINQYYGAPQNKVELGNINNAQLSLISNSVPATGNTANFDFNLNNISATSANFYVTGVTVLNSNGVALPSNDVTSTIPSVAVTKYTSSAANTVTISTSGTSNNLSDGETVYLNAAAAPTLNGIPLAAGYYTVQNATSTSFDVTLAGVTGDGSFVNAGATDTALPPYSSVASGQTARTGGNGTFTVSGLTSGPTSPYYTVQANIATVGPSGNIITSTVTYTLPNNSANTANDLIGANTATGGGKLVAPTSTQPLITASLVNAQGVPLQETNGSYGSQQGYLKITADNSANTVAIDELNSTQATTGQGFSQYYGLNNFFTPNPANASGNTVTNSALNLSVSSALIANPGLIAIGTLSQSNQPAADSGSPPNFTYMVAPGDNSISQQMAGIATATESFTASGGMAASSTTLAQYAGEIISKTSNDSTDATNSATDSQTLLTGFTQRAQSVSGVNLDQELANTVIYQNAYSASTRVITVVGNMFDQLLSIIQ